MIIRSQNKEDLMLMDDISIVRKGDFKDITSAYAVVCYRHGTHCVLGEYSTREKAIKVLDMIAQFYTLMAEIKLKMKFSAEKIPEYLEKQHYDCFEMPQDSEV